MAPAMARPLPHRPLRPGLLAILATAALLPAAARCGGGGTVVTSGTGASSAHASGSGASGTGGAGTGASGHGGSATCHAPGPGAPFTFHVHNGGTEMLFLAYGCGSSLPIVLDTPKGMLGIAPGPTDGCGFSCTAVYAGMTGSGCSDCGGGTGDPLVPGATVDVPWDHRVYTEIQVDPSCKNASAPECALGEVAAGSATQKGTLTVCTGGASAGGGPSGYCVGSKMVGFTVDTTQSSGTIEVM
jgi:hypothetical protein